MIDINYSIIIPHKNIPKLLKRCIDSIPIRKDLQVIVVDDCSNQESIEEIKNMSIEYPHISFIYSEISGGGGKARNEGLKFAKGKYILFADADDFFNYCIVDILEEYKNTNYDIVYFNANSLDTDTYITTYRCRHLNRMIHLYNHDSEKAVFLLKYSFGEPWCKMAKRDIIKNNNITFSETIIHNDTKFSYLIGHHSSDIHVDSRSIYCVTDRTGSVSKCTSVERLFTRTHIFSEATQFYIEHNIHLYGELVFTPLYDFLLRGDYTNCKKCYSIMKSYNMSNYIIIKGFFKFAINKLVRTPFRFIRKIVNSF